MKPRVRGYFAASALSLMTLLHCSFAQEPTVRVIPPPPAQTVEAELPLLQRVEQAEARIRQLQSERASAPEVQQADRIDVKQPRWPGLLLVHDPEVAAAREALEEAARPPAVPKPGEEKKEKKWYEKLSIRGYTQFRINEVVEHKQGPGFATPQAVGDSSIGQNLNFLIRRARLIISGDVSDHVYVYLQPDFATTPPGSANATFFTQIRDWYADLYLTTDKVHRLRVGQSKVPYGWENLQSSSNRTALDRNDAFNSTVRNERDLGVFYYWTPEDAQELFKYVLAEGLKGSGNYGVFGLGVYNGQGGSFLEQNENLHAAPRLTWPHRFDNGQIVEASVQAYTGKYTVFSAPIRPLGRGASFRPGGTIDATVERERNRAGIRDERVGWTVVVYPQPIGFQAEWTVGRGPTLNNRQTFVEEQSLSGGYAMALAKIDTDHCGIFYPYIRWQSYRGGYKSEPNAPFSKIDELEAGIEWQITPAIELVTQYTLTDRTNTRANDVANQRSYDPFEGQLVRLQLQVNY